jgi:hypothetical protein
MIQTQLFQKKEPIDDRRHSVSEFMEKPDLDIEVNYCKNKLKEISMKYDSTMISEWPALREKELYFYREPEWPALREKELYFYREPSRLQKLKKEKETTIQFSENKNNMVVLVENKPEKVRIKKSKVMKMNNGI